MTTYRTGNPIGSTDPRDLYDNAENLDDAVNDTNRDTWSDRLGRSRKTISGMEREFNTDQASRNNRFNTFIASSGYQFLGDYAAGIEITEYNQILRDADGEFWRLSGQVELPYTTTGAGLPEDDALTPLGDAVLRQELGAGVDSGGGALLVRGSSIYADSFSHLSSYPSGNLAEGQSAVVKGSVFLWDQSESKWAPGGSVSVRAFGATGVGDDTEACQSALDYMAAFATEQGPAPRSGRLAVLFDNSPTGVFPTTDTLNVSSLIDVLMSDPIEYSGPSDRPAMIHGEPGEVTWYPASTYRVSRSSTIWHLSPKPRGEETDVGLVLYNFNSAKSTVAQAQMFEVGVKMVGSDAGFAYNHISLGYLDSNKVQQWVYSENDGWNNENSYFGGRFSRIPSRVGSAQTCGIRSLRGAGSVSTHNNNTWYSPSFEGQGIGSGEAQPVIDAEQFNSCRILYCRDEGNGDVFLKEGEDCRDSEINWGFLLGSGNTGLGRIDNTNSRFPTSFYSLGSQRKVLENHNRLVWASGNMGDVACPVDGNRVYVPGVHLMAVSASLSPLEGVGAIGSTNQVSIEGGGIKFTNSARALGIGIELGDSVESKTLYVKINDLGTLYTVCFDENMNHISPYAPGNESIVRGRVSTPPYPSSNFMGSMATSQNDEFFISMSPAVKYVFLAVAPGSGLESVYKRMMVYSSAFGNSVPFLPGSGHVSNGVVGIGPPTQGNSIRGQFILNREPSSGSPYGWRCLESGNPGLWEAVNITSP